MTDLLDEIRGLAKLGQYNLPDGVIPTHNFVSDALEASPMIAIQVLFGAVQNVCDPELVDATLVAQRLNRRNVKLV